MNFYLMIYHFNWQSNHGWWIWCYCIHNATCLFPARPSFADTHCAYPRRDGQAELTWVAGCSILVQILF